MRKSWSVWWLWLALLAALGHDLLPALHQHAHLGSAARAVQTIEAAQAVEALELTQAHSGTAPERSGTDADDCAICAHIASLCHALPTPPGFARDLQPGACAPPAQASATLPRIAWLLAATRAPPGLLSLSI